jgi:hypothetical protein
MDAWVFVVLRSRLANRYGTPWIIAKRELRSEEAAPESRTAANASSQNTLPLRPANWGSPVLGSKGYTRGHIGLTIYRNYQEEPRIYEYAPANHRPGCAYCS